MAKSAAFPGSFDPPTLGHLNIIRRAAGIFGRLLVVVAENRQKKYLFTAEERAEMLARMAAGYGNVEVKICDSLIVDFLKKEGVGLLVRGLRGIDDFSYEFELSTAYRTLDPGIETLFMAGDPKYFPLRSSLIKEIASFGGNVSGMVPPEVAGALGRKYGNGVE